MILYSFPIVVRGHRDPGLAADVFNGASGFDGLQNGDDLVFGESCFTHGDLLRGHNQYAGRSLDVNGPVYRDTYSSPPGSLYYPTHPSVSTDCCCCAGPRPRRCYAPWRQTPAYPRGRWYCCGYPRWWPPASYRALPVRCCRRA